MGRYRLTVTFDDDLTNVMSGLTLEELLNIILNETAQEDTIWIKIEKMEN